MRIYQLLFRISLLFAAHFAAWAVTPTTIANAPLAIVLRDLEGQDIPFDSLKGQWVFINYWARWCQPCLDEIPELNRFYEAHKTGNVRVFSVNFDAPSIVKQQRLIKKFHIQYPSLQKDPAEALHLGDIRGVPVTFVFNPKGKLVDALYGGQTIQTLEHQMRAKHIKHIS